MFRELIDEPGHVTDLYTAEAIDFIETKRESPFFLYVPFTAVHHPLDEPDPWLAKGRSADATRPQYAACTMHMDDCVGQIVQALKRTKQLENTLVVFFSDNGGTIDPADGDNSRYPGEYPKGEKLGLNRPLRGRKTQVYEGGIRTPAFVSWPGTLAKRKITSPLHVIDWMPTLCGLVGFQANQVFPNDDVGNDPLKWDGQDIWPILSGQIETPQPRTLYWRGVGERTSALREGDWKLIATGQKLDGNLELYDLATDPFEQRDVSAQHEMTRERLLGLLREQLSLDDDAVVNN